MKVRTDFLCELNQKKIWLRREDLIKEKIKGNKFRKLKYNLIEAKKMNSKAILTFGGAFSNHLYATSLSGHINGIKTYGIVRGKEWKEKVKESPTLINCINNGMTLIFVSRDTYKKKNNYEFWRMIKLNPSKFYIIPEGGTNDLAVKGCSEMLNKKDNIYDVLCCPVGTGGTVIGLIKSSTINQKIVGFSVLNNDNLKSDIDKHIVKKNWELNNRYTFGGYARSNIDLISFINNFKKRFDIQLDPIYTGKMLFGIFDLINKNEWYWGKNILIFHTGGIQGIEGFNRRQLKKGLTCIM